MSTRSNLKHARPPPDLSIVETIIDRIKAGVRSGQFASGQRLIEAEIRMLVGASRGSVREAMRRLAAEGLLDIEHQKGARVRRLSTPEAQSVYDIRELLEGLAARLAAQHVDRRGYRARLGEMVRKGRVAPSEYMPHNEAFHSLIVEMSENRRLIDMLQQLQLPAFLLLTHAAVDESSVQAALSRHRVIIRAVLAGDSRRAEAAMRSHIRRTGQFVVSRLARVLS